MIGVAGCGRMGKPMLRALRDAGTRAMGLDVLSMDEDWITTDPVVFAEDLETLIIVVRDAEQCQALLFGDQNVVGRASNLSRIVLSSTVSPRYVHDLHSQLPDGIALFDAPMSGASVAAEERKLTFMLGGDDEAVDELIPLLAMMGDEFYHMGGLGAGMQAKVLNNLLAASNTIMTRLVLDWSDQVGLDADGLLKLIHASSGQNWFASGYEQIEFAKDGHKADNTIGILIKDVAAAIDAAPEGSDLILPQTIMTNLRNLKPRKDPE